MSVSQVQACAVDRWSFVLRYAHRNAHVHELSNLQQTPPVFQPAVIHCISEKHMGQAEVQAEVTPCLKGC